MGVGGKYWLKVFGRGLREFREAREGSNSWLAICAYILGNYEFVSNVSTFLYEGNVCIEIDAGIFYFGNKFYIENRSCFPVFKAVQSPPIIIKKGGVRYGRCRKHT